jgi:acetyltransferase-like isoleucine patch superfamily enzyme
LFASNIFITDHYHGETAFDNMNIRPSLRKIYSKGAVVIEENVWVGQNVSIMPDVTIGKGCIIGANSVVTHNIPPFSVAAGVPAKVLKNINHEA